MVNGSQVYKIGGVSVYFPCKPYPSQFSMMDKIIKGVERGQNCLLESPTGSGKSLALLCSALGWQAEQLVKKEAEELEESMAANTSENCCCQCHQELPTPVHTQTNNQPDCKQITSPSPSPNDTIELDLTKEDEDDDFKDSNTSYRTPTLHKEIKKLRKHVPISYEDDYTPSKSKGDNSKDSGNQTDLEASPSSPKKAMEDCGCCWKNTSNKTKVPRIYFGTRTHKQVAQIVRELRKTAYHDVRMTILGSREFTCIHPGVSKSKNKNEGCSELIKGPGCRFKDRSKRLASQKTIKTLGLDSSWDLEDLVSVGKKHGACPYFLSRDLKVQSELVICPYNYLIDPLIRESMEISIKDQIVILDEAHNIEDSSREAASQTVHLDTLEKSVSEIDNMIELNLKVGDHLKLKRMVRSLIEFIHQNSLHLEQKDFEQSSKIWTGFDIVAQMESMGLGPKDFAELQGALASVCEELDELTKQRLNSDGKLPQSILTMFEQIFLVFKYLYTNDMKFVEDYRAALLKTMTYSNMPTNDQWLNPKQRRGKHRVPVVTYSLNFWCMSPAVAFSEFSNCKSVILSSGTLSPMSSFQSELGLTFPIQLEANHVIKDNQVWVGTLGQGPKGNTLHAVYRNLETFTFQDELGQLILTVCQTVPNGVLCFLPSYRVLDKLSQRWKMTGLWSSISSKKLIVSEPRGGDKEDFEYLMKQFYHAADNTSTDSDSCNEYDDEDGEKRETNGALFLAVCRGKVSEGLDFADNYARAVISVGIPYPNFKDLQVELKRKYNDQHREKKGLLSGSDWYEIQAFRALNQALGRCIRHRHDWGGLILVDDRFVKNGQKYCKGLSKWVRNKVRTFHDFGSGLSSLSSFVEYRVENHEKETNASFISSTPTEVQKSEQQGDKSGAQLSSPQTPGPNTGFKDSLYSFNRRLYLAAETPSYNEKLLSPETPCVKNVDMTNMASIFQLTHAQVQQRMNESLKTPTNSLKSRAVTPIMTSTPLTKIINVQQNTPMAEAKNGQMTNSGLSVNNNILQNASTPKNSVVNASAPKNNIQVVYIPPGDYKPGQLLNINIGGKIIQVPYKGQTLKSPPQNLTVSQNMSNTNMILSPGQTNGSHVTPSKPTQSEIKHVLTSPSMVLNSVQKTLPQNVVMLPVQNSNSSKTNMVSLLSPPHKTSGNNVQFLNLLNQKSPPVSTCSSANPQTVSLLSPPKPATQFVNVANINGQLVMLPKSGKQTIKVATIGGKTVIIPEGTSINSLTSLLAQTPASNNRQPVTSHPIQLSSNDNGSFVSKTVEIGNTDFTMATKQTNHGSISNPIEIENEPKKNKFFKFCSIPNKENDTKSEIPANTDEISSTPLLFDSELEFDDAKNDSAKPAIRKPLFRRKSDETNKEQKKEEIVNEKPKKQENVAIPQKKEILHNTRNRNTRRGSLSLSNKKSQKKDPDTMPDLKTENCDVLSASENKIVEEEALSIRRKGKRRRSGNCNVRVAPKKSKGVEFVEELEDTDENIENQCASISCRGCGVTLVNNPVDLEKRKRVPGFFPKLNEDKIQEVIYLSQLDSEDYLQPLHTQLGTGQELNSLFCMEEKVCIKYLTCISCYPNGTSQETFGCQVIYTDSSSKYTVGQTWLYADRIKVDS